MSSKKHARETAKADKKAAKQDKRAEATEKRRESQGEETYPAGAPATNPADAT
jgi:hypothetical protein